jgi:hypothetical protein
VRCARKRSLSFVSKTVVTSLVLTTVLTTSDQRGHRHQRSEEAASSSGNCFEPGNPSDIRLWSQAAPGAVGNDPSRDIPYVQVFRPSGVQRCPTPTILIIPGGGYDRLSDTDEQAPVAEYFARTFQVTAVVLYYRLVQKDGSYRNLLRGYSGKELVELQNHLSGEKNVTNRLAPVFLLESKDDAVISAANSVLFSHVLRSRGVQQMPISSTTVSMVSALQPTNLRNACGRRFSDSG